MENLRLAQNLLDEIGRRAGVSLRLSDKGTLALAYDQDSRFFLQVIDQAILFSAPLELSILPGNEPLLRHILQLNFLNQQSEGCTLGLDPVKGEVWLSYILLLNGLGANEFDNACVNFMATADRLRQKVRAISAESSTPDSTEEGAAALLQHLRA